jgi:hypothetical protein
LFNLRPSQPRHFHSVRRVKVRDPDGGEEEDGKPGDPGEELDEAESSDVRGKGAGGGDDGAEVGEEGWWRMRGGEEDAFVGCEEGEGVGGDEDGGSKDLKNNKMRIMSEDCAE